MNDNLDKKTPDDGRTRTENKVGQRYDKTLDALNRGPITYGTVLKYTLWVLVAVFISFFLFWAYNGNEDSAIDTQTEPESVETVVERVRSTLQNDASEAEE
ncbi:MAG: hypothetical protein LPH21_12605 [Shewanella sp.]|nr:hypothetical protein [Shewanella sp.]